MSMSILVHAEGYRLTNDLKGRIIEKVERLESHANNALRARVAIRRVSLRPSDRQFEASILIEVPGRDISAMQKASKPLEAVDLLVEKVGRQLRKRKTVKIVQRAQQPEWRVAAAM